MSTSEKELTTVEDIRFICSRCQQILRLDPSIGQMDEKTLTELANTAKQLNADNSDKSNDVHISEKPLNNCSESDRESERSRSLSDAQAGSESSSSNTENRSGCVTSFTMIGDVNNTTMETFSHKLNMVIKLFDIISSNTTLDHPLCEECTDQVLDQLDKELGETQLDAELYKKFFEELESSVPSSEELDTLADELESLKSEEQRLLAQLESTEKERELKREKIKELKIQKCKFEEEEKKFLKEYADFRAKQLDIDQEQKSIDNLMKIAEIQLNQLRKTNVFNATFHIWHQGPFGTINGFRLGRLPSAPVDWNEINAAWGQTTLLLASLIKKMGLKLQRYRLVPFGNHSYIETLDVKSKGLPLYGSGGFRLIWDTKFDQGMVAFLDCLQQFKVEVENSKKGFTLPYKMENGRIEDTSSTNNSLSIKLQFNSEEQWTKALKFMLTNLKWGLAWISTELPSTPVSS